MDEDWVKLDTSYDPTTQYMHKAYRQSEYMNDLVTQAWEGLDKSYHSSEERVARIMHHALGQGEHEEVYQLHKNMHPTQRLQSVHDLLEPYMRHLFSGQWAYDMHGDMPPIQHYQLPRVAGEKYGALQSNPK